MSMTGMGSRTRTAVDSAAAGKLLGRSSPSSPSPYPRLRVPPVEGWRGTPARLVAKQAPPTGAVHTHAPHLLVHSTHSSSHTHPLTSPPGCSQT